MSAKSNNPNWKIGTGDRWGQYKGGFKEEYTTPGPESSRWGAGWPHWCPHAAGVGCE
jgi:hypothetical protein